MAFDSMNGHLTTQQFQTLSNAINASPALQQVSSSLPQTNISNSSTRSTQTANLNGGMIEMQQAAASMTKGMVISNTDFINGQPTAYNLQLMQQLGIQYSPNGPVQQFAAQQPMQAQSPKFLVKEAPEPARSNSTDTTKPTMQDIMSMFVMALMQYFVNDEQSPQLIQLFAMMSMMVDAPSKEDESRNTPPKASRESILEGREKARNVSS